VPKYVAIPSAPQKAQFPAGEKKKGDHSTNLEISLLLSGHFINVPSKVLKCSLIRSCSFGRRTVPTLTQFLFCF
jgi:hypothetical protein